MLPSRLWRLGRIPFDGKTREVLLARRLGDADGASVINHIGSGGRSIVLVPARGPDERLWVRRVPAVIALTVRRDAFSQAIGLTQRFAPVAVNTLVKVMADDTAPHHARVSAASTLLKFSRDGLELDDLAMRVDALEQASEDRGHG